jgi:cystathionine beta-lyase
MAIKRVPSKNGLSEDFDARRLENAVWRLWQKENSTGADSPDASLPFQKTGSYSQLFSEEDFGSHDAFLQKVQDAIGDSVNFPTIRFPQGDLNCEYDELPTFPIRPNFANFKNKLYPASECVVFDGCPEDPYHPSNTPIYQTATFVQPSANEFGAYDYTRSGNPTRTALEKHVAMLEQAAASFAFASGMAALHTVTRLLRCGDEILCNEDIYGGMHRLLTQDAMHSGITITFVDTTDIKSVESKITSKTKIIHTESPSNPRMRISDLRALAELAHRYNLLLSVDSTMMPPVICKPLMLGVDIVIHSATKFFSGHADCTGGLVSVKSPDLAQKIAFFQNAEGTALAPFECFLFLRGIKTMHLRVERAQQNAKEIVNYLCKSGYTQKVFYPGKGGCDPKSLAIHQSQCCGTGAVISFTTGSVEFSRRFLDACRIFKTTVSFGSVNSLGEMPCTMSHASIPSEKRTLPEDLVRLSVGIEDVLDLVDDLQKAFEIAGEEMSPCRDNGFDSKFEDLPVVPRIPSSMSLVKLTVKTMCSEVPMSGPPTMPGSDQTPSDGSSVNTSVDTAMVELPTSECDEQELSMAAEKLAPRGILAPAPWKMAAMIGTAVFLTWRARLTAASS